MNEHPWTLCVDLDGTLLDVRNRHFVVYQTVVTELGGIPLPIDVFWEKKRANIAVTELMAQSGLSRTQLSAYYARFMSRIEHPDYLVHDSLLPGVVSALAALKDMHLILVHTRADARSTHDQLQTMKLMHIFDEVHLTETTAHSKYEDILPTTPDKRRTIVVGDSEADIIAAQYHGYICIAVTSGVRNREQLSHRLPDYIIDSVAQVPAIIEMVMNKGVQNQK